MCSASPQNRYSSLRLSHQAASPRPLQQTSHTTGQLPSSCPESPRLIICFLCGGSCRRLEGKDCLPVRAASHVKFTPLEHSHRGRELNNSKVPGLPHFCYLFLLQFLLWYYTCHRKPPSPLWKNTVQRRYRTAKASSPSILPRFCAVSTVSRGRSLGLQHAKCAPSNFTMPGPQKKPGIKPSTEGHVIKESKAVRV